MEKFSSKLSFQKLGKKILILFARQNIALLSCVSFQSHWLLGSVYYIQHYSECIIRALVHITFNDTVKIFKLNLL